MKKITDFTWAEAISAVGIFIVIVVTGTSVIDLYRKPPSQPVETPQFRVQVIERQTLKNSAGEVTILRDSLTGTEVLVYRTGGVGVAAVVLNKEKE